MLHSYPPAPLTTNTVTTNSATTNSATTNSAHCARQWWATLDDAARQRLRDHRRRYLPGDIVESMAAAGIPTVGDGSWSCVGVGPTGFTMPAAVVALLDS